MSIQTEFDSRNPPFDRLSKIEGKHNSAMQCANPKCTKELLYLREGSLQLLVLESDADDQPRQDDGAFAMKPLRSRFFWLCGECSKTHIVKRWTASGLVLMLRNQIEANNSLNLRKPPIAATTTQSLTVPPKSPVGQPPYRSAALVLQRN
jgi:hypothetical protein